jgi:hypothetical protein
VATVSGTGTVATWLKAIFFVIYEKVN